VRRGKKRSQDERRGRGEKRNGGNNIREREMRMKRRYERGG
jgi:hypothetical protein